MITFLEQFSTWIKVLVNILTYAIIPMFSLFVVYGLLKWINRTKEGIKEVSKNPLYLVLWLILSIVLVIIVSKFVIPYFKI